MTGNRSFRPSSATTQLDQTNIEKENPTLGGNTDEAEAVAANVAIELTYSASPSVTSSRSDTSLARRTRSTRQAAHRNQAQYITLPTPKSTVSTRLQGVLTRSPQEYVLASPQSSSSSQNSITINKRDLGKVVDDDDGGDTSAKRKTSSQSKRQRRRMDVSTEHVLEQTEDADPVVDTQDPRTMSSHRDASSETPGSPIYEDEGTDQDKRGPLGGARMRFQCDECGLSFTRMHNLKSHALTHSREKPFICNTCNSSFRRLHDLKRHHKLHTGERPFVCHICNRSFARQDALNRHAKPGGGCIRSRSVDSLGPLYRESSVPENFKPTTGSPGQLPHPRPMSPLSTKDIHMADAPYFSSQIYPAGPSSAHQTPDLQPASTSQDLGGPQYSSGLNSRLLATSHFHSQTYPPTSVQSRRNLPQPLPHPHQHPSHVIFPSQHLQALPHWVLPPPHSLTTLQQPSFPYSAHQSSSLLTAEMGGGGPPSASGKFTSHPGPGPGPDSGPGPGPGPGPRPPPTLQSQLRSTSSTSSSSGGGGGASGGGGGGGDGGGRAMSSSSVHSVARNNPSFSSGGGSIDIMGDARRGSMVESPKNLSTPSPGSLHASYSSQPTYTSDYHQHYMDQGARFAMIPESMYNDLLNRYNHLEQKSERLESRLLQLEDTFKEITKTTSATKDGENKDV